MTPHKGHSNPDERTPPPPFLHKIKMRSLKFLCIAIAPIFLLGVANAQQNGRYTLNVQDKISISVGQWRAAEGTYEHFNGLSSEHTVGPDGGISLTLIGRIEAEGRTTDEVADEITLKLQEQLGLAQPLSATVELLSYRPIFVVGAVNAPGTFAYQSDLTTLQAVGLAGGHLRSGALQSRAELQALNAIGTYEEVRLRIWSREVRMARLEAEFEGKDAIDVPDAIEDQPEVVELLALEKEIMKAGKEELKSKLAVQDELKALLRSQIEKLGKETLLRQEEAKLATDQLNDVLTLRKQGLAVNARERELKTAAIDLEARILALEVAKLTAERDLNEAERIRLDLVSKKKNDVVLELSDLRDELNQLMARQETAKRLYGEAASQGAAVNIGELNTVYSYEISRQENGKTVRVAADEAMALKPGDTLIVNAVITEDRIAPSVFPQLPN